MTIITIAQCLGMTPEQYEKEYYDRYYRWCSNYAIKDAEGVCPVDLQKLMASPAAASYYSRNHAELEAHAYELLAPHINTQPVDVSRRIYNAIMVDLFKYFSLPLFKEARKKLTIENNPYDYRSN